MSIQDKERSCYGYANLSFLAFQSLVSNSVGNVDRHSQDFEFERRSSPELSGRVPSPSNGSIPPTHRVEVVRKRWIDAGFPEEVAVILLEGTRPNTRTSYQCAWRSWRNWCMERSKDPLHGSLVEVLSYLTTLKRKGYAYSSINLHKSMLSMTLEPVSDIRIGNHPLCVQFMRGLFNSNPPKPRYNHTWDVNIVLEYISFSGKCNDISLLALSCRAVIILALTSLLRVSEIAKVNKSSILFSDNDVSFYLSQPRKWQRKGPLLRISIPKFVNSTFCPVRIIETYISRSDRFRNESNG